MKTLRGRRLADAAAWVAIGFLIVELIGAGSWIAVTTLGAGMFWRIQLLGSQQQVRAAQRELDDVSRLFAAIARRSEMTTPVCCESTSPCPKFTQPTDQGGVPSSGFAVSENPLHTLDLPYGDSA